jgi:hypothetical protein
VEEDLPVRAAGSDILTEMSGRANFFTLPRFGWNDLSRNSHPFTESERCRGQLQDTRLKSSWASAHHCAATFSETALAWVKSKR